MPKGIKESGKYEVSLDDGTKKEFNSQFETNKFLLKEIGDKKPVSITQICKGVTVDADLVNGTLSINGDNLDIDLDENKLSELKKNGFRWVNFNRARISMHQDDPSKSFDTVLYVIGWQSIDDKGENIQRLIAVDEDGKWELMKKR